MASKEMAYFNVGNDEFEIVDDAGRQATSAVDEKVDAVDEKVDGLSASNLPYSSTQSTKQAIDEKVSFTNYISDIQAGIVSGINLVANTQQEITVTLPRSFSGGDDYAVCVDIEYYGMAGTVKHIIRNKYATGFVVRIISEGNMNGVKMQWMVSRVRS